MHKRRGEKECFLVRYNSKDDRPAGRSSGWLVRRTRLLAAPVVSPTAHNSSAARWSGSASPASTGAGRFNHGPTFRIPRVRNGGKPSLPHVPPQRTPVPARPTTRMPAPAAPFRGFATADGRFCDFHKVPSPAVLSRCFRRSGAPRAFPIL